MYLKKVFPCIGMLLLALFCAGCSVAPKGQAIYDPYETVNRGTHAVNKGIDSVLIRPASLGYRAVIPEDVSGIMSNVAQNLRAPKNIANNLLQANIKGAAQNLMGFALNTTIGIAGVGDVASSIGLPAVHTSFDETLFVYGVPEGAYTEFPIFGGGVAPNERASVGFVVDAVLNPLGLSSDQRRLNNFAQVADFMKLRGDLSPQIDALFYESEDSYSLSRETYLQLRRFQLGDRSNETFIDPYEDF